MDAKGYHPLVFQGLPNLLVHRQIHLDIYVRPQLFPLQHSHFVLTLKSKFFAQTLCQFVAKYFILFCFAHAKRAKDHSECHDVAHEFEGSKLDF